MFRNGQLVNVFLGEDRQMYIDISPGKSLCEFGGRVWIQEKENNILSITEIPEKFDGKPVIAPPGWEIQGLENEEENAEPVKSDENIPDLEKPE